MVSGGPIAVVGAGSWGSALAHSFRQGGQRTTLWARRPEQVEELRRGENPRYLPGVELGDVGATGSLEEALAGDGPVLLAVPSAAVAGSCSRIRELSAAPRPVVCAAKGLEAGSGRRLSQVMADALGPGWPGLVLLGPSHAEEVARGMPTAIVLAGADATLRGELQERFSGPALRVYTNEDLAGVEYAAALKNVLAIAAGICDGLGLGDNTKGALLTRGLAEIARLGTALGGQRDTFYGLAGVGDVITTCLSRHSRNRALGEELGRGQSLDAAVATVGQVAEGVGTTRTVVELARRHGQAVPISQKVGEVLFGGLDPARAIDELMARRLKAEWGGHGPAPGKAKGS